MANSDHTSQPPPEVSDPISEAELDRALEIAPKGALALAGAAVALLMLAYLLVYFLVFLPRGAVS
jgi:hypothetical protein